MNNYKFNMLDVISIMEEKSRYIKIIKGNIPINNDLLGKYTSVKQIFKNINNNTFYYIDEKSFNYDLNLDITGLKKYAPLVFQAYHSNNIFLNSNNKIYITNSGLNESVHKMLRNSKQKKLIQFIYK